MDGLYSICPKFLHNKKYPLFKGYFLWFTEEKCRRNFFGLQRGGLLFAVVLYITIRILLIVCS